jgi:hypothetical protein
MHYIKENLFQVLIDFTKCNQCLIDFLIYFVYDKHKS